MIVVSSGLQHNKYTTTATITKNNNNGSKSVCNTNNSVFTNINIFLYNNYEKKNVKRVTHHFIIFFITIFIIIEIIKNCKKKNQLACT